MSVIKLTLPPPPSINGAFKNARKGRVKTDIAKTWRVEAIYHLKPFLSEHNQACESNLMIRFKASKSSAKTCSIHRLRQGNPDLAYVLTYRYFFSDDSPRDVMNFEKVLTDLLVELGFMLDDCFVIKCLISLEKPDSSRPRVEVEILPVDRKIGMEYNKST